jgi:hypothetical protein
MAQDAFNPRAFLDERDQPQPPSAPGQASTSRPNVPPAWEALRRSLELGTGVVVVEHDEDLDSVRRLPEYAAWMPEYAAGIRRR